VVCVHTGLCVVLLLHASSGCELPACVTLVALLVWVVQWLPVPNPIWRFCGVADGLCVRPGEAHIASAMTLGCS
jgi:hypothetical protein